MLGVRGIDWRSQRGSSMMMLLMIWAILVGFLGVAFDLAMSYVYRQQVRTAMEAAVTAGAIQGEYEMQVRLYRRHYQWIHGCTPYKNPDGTSGCAPWKQLTVTGTDAVDTYPGRESVVWAPYRYRKTPTALSNLHPGLCDAVKDDDSYKYCERAEVVKSSCRVVETSSGAAVAAAQEAFRANKQRWEGKLQNVKGGQPRLAADKLKFEVTMDITAEMPTMFLRMIGIPTIPIRVQGAELSGSHGAEIVRLGDDPCR
ncbi:MAG TPA: Tad domain-containing protein [Symbiobacteriaceae bacterium]|nr:Tad domain-containing protein [Symbiobacteriaceae bacterium]